MAWTNISRYTNGQKILHSDLNSLGNNLNYLYVSNVVFSTQKNDALQPANSTTTSQVPVALGSISEVSADITTGGVVTIGLSGLFSISAGTGFIGIAAVADNGSGFYDNLPFSYDAKILKTTRTPITIIKSFPVVNYGSFGTILIVYWYTSTGGTLTLYDDNVAIAGFTHPGAFSIGQ